MTDAHSLLLCSFASYLHFQHSLTIIYLIIVFTGEEEKNPVFRAPSPNDNNILVGSGSGTRAASAKPVMQSCVVLLATVLLGRISLVLLNG